MSGEHIYDTVQIWGFLPPTYTQAAAPDLLDGLLDLLSFPRDESGQALYPYRVYGDSREEGVTADREEVYRSFVESRTGTIAAPPGEPRVRYGETPLSVSVLGPDEQFPSTPALLVEPDMDCFVDGSSVSDLSVTAHSEQLFELVVELRDRFDLPVVFGFGQKEPVGADTHPDRERALHGRVSKLYWLTVLPAETVDGIGRETVTAAPAWKTETLSDGAVLLVTHENPRRADDRYGSTADLLGLEGLGY